MQLSLKGTENVTALASHDVVSSAEWDQGFEDFWSACWRRVGKHPCREVWSKLKPKSGSRQECEDLFNAILDAAMRHGRVYANRDMERRPHPITWLRQRRWEDEDA
jgi:hypothetical protein